MQHEAFAERLLLIQPVFHSGGNLFAYLMQEPNMSCRQDS